MISVGSQLINITKKQQKQNIYSEIDSKIEFL